MDCACISTHQAYLFENSSKIVNCSCILVFLKQSTCYAITPDTHQWNRINTNEVTDNHKVALCNDMTVHMIPLPPAELCEINAYTTIARLTFSQAQNEHLTIPAHNLCTVNQLQ